MEHRSIVLGAGSLALFVAVSLAACDDSGNPATSTDAGGAGDASNATANDSGAAPVTSDAGSDAVADAADSAAPPPPRLLLSYNGSASTEMVAWNLATNAVDGRLTVPSYLGATYVSGAAPFFLAQATDQVLKLDANEPWKVVSSWSVAGPDKSTDGGVMDSYADPDTAVVAAGSKAYVLRYTRLKIAVLDTTQTADGGAPSKLIDLSSLLDPKDSDGVPEATAAYFDAPSHRLYVLLGNVDRNRFDPGTYALICSGLHSTLVAIDTTTDSLVSLGGTATGGGITLPGYNALVGVKMGYDAANNRLLVLQAGCNQGVDAGAAVNLQQREVDEVRLATGVATKVLDLNGQAFPTQFLMAGGTTAILGTYGGTFLWNTAGSALGAMIPNAPDSFTVDGQGSLVGLSQTYFVDGGAGPLDVVRVMQDGGAATLGHNAQSIKAPFYVGGVDVWP